MNCFWSTSISQRSTSEFDQHDGFTTLVDDILTARVDVIRGESTESTESRVYRRPSGGRGRPPSTSSNQRQISCNRLLQHASETGVIITVKPRGKSCIQRLSCMRSAVELDTLAPHLVHDARGPHSSNPLPQLPARTNHALFVQY